jgi:four helix bundle protein
VGAKTFRDLVAWQLARQLRQLIAQLARKPTVAQEFDLTSQLKKAARSATGNIAEGFSCTHAEFARFLDISARSLREIEDRLSEAVDGELLTADEAAPVFELKKRAATAVSRLTDYLRRSPEPPNFKPRPPRSSRDR